MTFVLAIVIFFVYLTLSADINSTHNVQLATASVSEEVVVPTQEYIPSFTELNVPSSLSSSLLGDVLFLSSMVDDEVATVDYTAKTIRELKALAKQHKLPKYSNMTKAVLANALAQHIK